MNTKTIRKNKSKRKNKSSQTKKIDYISLIKKSIINFKNKFHVIRHLHTTDNIIRSIIPYKIQEYHFNKKYNRSTKGGSIIKYIPSHFNPIKGEPTISYKGEKDAINLFKEYNIYKSPNNKYTIFVSGYVRTWITAVLCLRSLSGGAGFELTLIITNIATVTSKRTPHSTSMKYFRSILLDNEIVHIKLCTDINKKKYTCKLVDVVDSVHKTKRSNSISYKVFYKHITNKKFSSNNIFEVIYMVSKSCKGVYKEYKDIIFIGHSGSIYKSLQMLNIPDMKLIGVNAYLMLFSLLNKKVNLKVLIAGGITLHNINLDKYNK